jgi:hypothetical protein
MEEKSDFPTVTTYEYVCCPYCGSLDFDELPPNHKPQKQQPSKPVQLPQPAKLPVQKSESSGIRRVPRIQFNPTDLMEHLWKGKKTGDRQYENKGKLPVYGWDFANELQPSTVSFLKGCENQTHMIDRYRFALDGKLVKMQTVNQKKETKKRLGGNSHGN